jgi:hypothetical protein
MNISFIYSMKNSDNPVKPLRGQTEIQYGISCTGTELLKNMKKWVFSIITQR